MARIRTIKPSFFRSDDVSALPMRARLTWIGLWTQCDDQGRTKDHARLIKADIWPLDNVSLADIEEDLETLAEHRRIVRYEVGGQRYLEIVNWHDHQTIQKPTPSRIPAPPHTGNGRLPETYGSATSGKGRERKGREGDARAREEPPTLDASGPEPPLKCEKHTKTRNPPNCGGCADARKAHNRWEAERSRRLANAPRCRLHDTELAEHCRICRSEELNPA